MDSLKDIKEKISDILEVISELKHQSQNKNYRNPKRVDNCSSKDNSSKGSTRENNTSKSTFKENTRQVPQTSTTSKTSNNIEGKGNIRYSMNFKFDKIDSKLNLKDTPSKELRSSIKQSPMLPTTRGVIQEDEEINMENAETDKIGGVQEDTFNNGALKRNISSISKREAFGHKGIVSLSLRGVNIDHIKKQLYDSKDI
jgi:hypothetical protein